MPDWVEVFIRALGMLILLFFAAKLIGKKSISHMSYFDYIAGITIGGIAAITAIDLNIDFMFGMIAIILFAGISFLIDLIALKSKTFRDIVDGKGTILIKDGKILEDNLKKQQYTSDMLLEQLRKKDVFKTADVEFAVLEQSGDVSVLLKRDKQPITASDIKLELPLESEPQTVIMDGEVMNEPLATLGLSKGWLKGALDKKGVAIENVYLAQVDAYGQLTLDLFDDKILMPEPTELPLLLSSIKKCQADLEAFALATESQEAKQMYAKNAKKVDAVIQRITPYLQ